MLHAILHYKARLPYKESHSFVTQTDKPVLALTNYKEYIPIRKYPRIKLKTTATI
jgi:hypothetical protein